MAATTEQSSEMLAIIDRLQPDDIPIKLRCSICNNLSLDAFRLLCCSQNICESCQSSLPTTCPVCEHTPLAADGVVPNRPMRTTIRAFLKTKAASQKNNIKTQPTPPASTSTETKLESEAPGKVDTPQPEAGNVVNGTKEEVPAPVTFEPNKSDPESKDEASEPNENGSLQKENEATNESFAVAVTSNEGETSDQQGPNTAPMNQESQQNWAHANGMNNPMMPQMQGGMGGFNQMMGMPGMNMDMMSMPQGMFGGFGGPGMGMNGMNMGMGMGFDANQGAFTGWNGQPAWNSGQDNFNHIANNAHANGMGAYQAHVGYQSTPGFNQFHQMQHQQFSSPNIHGNFHHGAGNFQRGRGRGGYGRGRGYFQGQGPQNSYNNSNYANNQHPTQYSPRQDSFHSQSTTGQDAADSATEARALEPVSKQTTEETGRDREFQPEEEPAELGVPSNDEQDTRQADEIQNADPQGNDAEDQAPNGESVINKAVEPPSRRIPNIDQSRERTTSNASDGIVLVGSTEHIENISQSNGVPRESSTLKSPTQSDTFRKPHIEPRGLGVAGAPTGPKALRQGNPNVGFRGRGGFNTYGRGAFNGGFGSSNRSHEADGYTDRNRSRSRSRSPPHAESDRHRHRHRHRSASVESGHNDRDRHQRNFRKRGDEKEDEFGRLKREDRAEASRSRSRSPETKHTSSRHQRDADVDHDSSRKHRSSHRSHRDRDRSKDRRHHRRRSRSAETESKEARRERRREKERESRNDGRRSSRRDSHYEEKASRNGERHRDDRRESTKAAEPKVIASAGQEMNSHDREREARNQERLIKEQQRLEELQGRAKAPVESHRKRGREVEGMETSAEQYRSRRNKRSRSRRGSRNEEDGNGNGRRASLKKRRVNYKYEDEESNEARAQRVENEREASRWE